MVQSSNTNRFETPTEEKAPEGIISTTAQIVSAFLSNPNNRTDPANLPGIIHDTHAALSNLSKPTELAKELVPAVAIKRSITPEYIVCLEDGKKFKSLKRHLRTHYNMSPEEYREKWSLPPDYPMTAPAYSEARSALAKAMGLGNKPKAPVVVETPKSKPKAKAKAPVSAS